jgi:hypothetical protein
MVDVESTTAVVVVFIILAVVVSTYFIVVESTTFVDRASTAVVDGGYEVGAGKANATAASTAVEAATRRCVERMIDESKIGLAGVHAVLLQESEYT